MDNKELIGQLIKSIEDAHIKNKGIAGCVIRLGDLAMKLDHQNTKLKQELAEIELDNNYKILQGKYSILLKMAQKHLNKVKDECSHCPECSSWAVADFGLDEIDDFLAQK